MVKDCTNLNILQSPLLYQKNEHSELSIKPSPEKFQTEFINTDKITLKATDITEPYEHSPNIHARDFWRI